ncbi:hypothetical protein C1H46_013875 [Malus baccata]|uniref:PRONE domain-containing protein n=1 Tax=Malus baccata TaxID=106549 RepID=A0A540MP19_MALBA|nr:hypothetical protein C1H46_013875 [Malus baccata]
MDNSPSYDEHYDLGYQPSPSSVDQTDHSLAETSTSGDSFMYRRTNSETSAYSESVDDSSNSGEASPWFYPNVKSNPLSLTRLGLKQYNKNASDDKLEDHKAVDSATVFGQNLRLEPLNPEKKAMWKREMNCLLSVCDYMVELIPISQNLQEGAQVELMESRPRSDLYINLPALKKLDAMLIEVLDSFQNTEFWYAEKGSMSSNSTRTGSFRRVVVQRNEEKWWLPIPCVPPGGLSEKARKHLKHKRDSCNQIHKAAMAINSSILAEMEIPDSYMSTLPKSGKACLGDSIYHYMCTTDKFSPDQLLDCLDIATELEALNLADRVEASMYTWRRKACMSNSKSSWIMVKDLMSETDWNDKNYVLAERAECLLFCLKQRYPELSQTSLDTCKIQCNRDVGQAVLESYSRVLESLAFNIVAWIEDVICVDRSARNQDK